MYYTTLLSRTARLLAVLGLLSCHPGWAVNYAIVGWNNLGMHCMDSDFSVFSILPPYNTIDAQVIYQGHLLTSAAGVTVTYEAVADPAGSLNSTSQGKGNFWDYAEALYGATLAPEMGLAGFAMPGLGNVPQTMTFDPSWDWFEGTGVPITPWDNTGRKNFYPMMRLVARSGNTVLAATDIVLPVSDEMDCRACHASGAGSQAEPLDGWVWDCDSERDYRLNILQLHDDYITGGGYESELLQSVGYHPEGLIATVLSNGTPVLCARCHTSEALPGSGVEGLPPLTRAIHSLHAYVDDPVTGLPLESSANRASCYRCHPGAETRCLRGAMGSAVGSDGAMLMQCQSCHGSMSRVGALNRTGWLEEPNCQSCHTGTATSNNGQIRYTSVFETNGQERVAVNQTFATNPDTPGVGLSLYRFSSGHGGLQCAACHGSTHAEYVSAHPNDNVQSQQRQGHVGVLAECTACHVSTPSTVSGGPHGLHPMGSSWLDGHKDPGKNVGQCRPCHGANDRGTVLSRMQATRTFNMYDGASNLQFARGSVIGCYSCHQGPFNNDRNPNSRPVASSDTATTGADTPVGLTLSASDANGQALTYRILSQPAHGLVSLTNQQATYFPDRNYVGDDAFTFVASDNSIDSLPATVSLTVTQGVCELVTTTAAPANAQQHRNVPFRASAQLTHCDAVVGYVWTFGDGSVPSPDRETCHVYQTPGTYAWALVATADGMSQTNHGVITITADPTDPVVLTIVQQAGTVVLSWPVSAQGVVLESTGDLNPIASWSPAGDSGVVMSNQVVVTIPDPAGTRFYRLRQTP